MKINNIQYENFPVLIHGPWTEKSTKFLHVGLNINLEGLNTILRGAIAPKAPIPILRPRIVVTIVAPNRLLAEGRARAGQGRRNRFENTIDLYEYIRGARLPLAGRNVRATVIFMDLPASARCRVPLADARLHVIMNEWGAACVS